MNIETYFQNVEKLADIVNEEEITVEALIEDPGDHESIVNESANFRETILSETEEASLSSYLFFGYFSGQTCKERLARFAMVFEVQHEAARRALREQCEPYEESQPLFQAEPELFSKIRTKSNGKKDFELIDLKAINHVNRSEVYETKNGFTKLCRHLNPTIVNWTKENWPSAPTYVRCDANAYFDTQPLQTLMEATIVPANPNWFKDFSLRKNMKDSAVYALLDREPKEGQREYWEFNVKHLRRLEVYVSRRKDDYLSMLIEELPREDDPNGVMIGRCIHLDTVYPAGTPLSEVKMQHIDLAINVYEEGDREKRFEQTLQQGKVQDATYRTHLLRVEGTPFISLFGFCEMFLGSKVLLSEWVNEIV